MRWGREEQALVSQSSLPLSDPNEGQAKMKRRAAADIICGPDFPPVCVNDGAADRKAKSHSLLLRREETLEDLFHVFFRNTATTIGNGYPHCAVLQLRSDKQSALRRIMIGHRFAAIHHQVKQYLLKLDPVADDCGQVLREGSIHSYVSIDQIAAH